MGAPKFEIPDPIGAEDGADGKPPAPPGSTGQAPGADSPRGGPRFEIPDPVETGAAPDPEASWDDILVSYARGLSPTHSRLGERLGNWAADQTEYARPEGATVAGKGLIDSIPDTWSTRAAKLAGNATMAVPAAYLGGSTIAGQAAVGGLSGALLNEGGIKERLQSGAIGALTSGAGAGLAKGVSAGLGALGSALKPAAGAVDDAVGVVGGYSDDAASAVKGYLPDWLAPTSQAAAQRADDAAVLGSVDDAVASKWLSALKPAPTAGGASSGLGDAAKRGLGGAVAGGLVTKAAGGDWKTGAALGALGAGGAKNISGAMLAHAPAIAARAAPIVSGGMRWAGQSAASAVSDRSSVPSNDAAMQWSLQSLLHTGNTGLPPADEARLTEAVTSGDADRVKAISYQMQMKYPEYAARVRGQLQSVQNQEN